MPTFKNHTVLEFRGSVRLSFRVEVGLTGLEAVLTRLKSLVEDIDFTILPSLLKKPVDLSTDYESVFPHIVLRQGAVVFTSVMMFLRKLTQGR